MTARDEIEALKREVQALRNEVNDLRRFQSWVMGAAAGVGAIFAFLAQGIKTKLGLE